MLLNQVRKEQTTLELRRLRAEAGAWVTARRKRDARGQYRTQLGTIESLLEAAGGHLESGLGGLDTGRPREDVYEQCRLFDLRVLWLRRVWRYYKDKFDQRDDQSLAPLLAAADEVVWSCYRQVFASAEALVPGIKQGPAPLPFVEFAYSPESFPSELVPYELKPDETGFLKEIIGRLPVPLVSLPQSCVTAPWWLVHIGHEVGHHVQFDLAPSSGLVKSFQAAVAKAVETAGGEFAEADGERWGYWGKEIFADIFSVLTMGPWAAWAMVEFELKRADEMSKARRQYPPPAVRLWMLAETAGRLGLDGASVLRGLDPAALVEGDAAAVRDLGHAGRIVSMALDEDLPGLGVGLKDLTDFRREEFEAGQAVDVFSRALRGLEPFGVSNSLRAARQVASASVAGWSGLLAGWEAEEENGPPAGEAERAARLKRRGDEREALAGSTLRSIAQSFEPSQRAGQADLDGSALGAELAEKLLAVSEKELTS